ncbi:MAG: tetratricopeptide repeat protein, partial [bacterium]
VTARAVATAAPWLAVAGGALLLLLAPVPAARPLSGSRLRAAVAAAAVVAAAVAATGVAPSWNKGIITAGSEVYAGRPTDPEGLRATLEAADVVFYEEGATGVTAVVGSTDGLLLRHGGLAVGSTAEGLPSQVLAAHIPLVMVENPRAALVVGLGTGITLGSAEAHELVRVDCVEPEAAVAAACRAFAPYNRDALNDSRLRLVTCDPANYLLVSRAKYDIITCGRPLPTPELARLARACLSPSGIVCEVVDLAGLPGEGLASLAREFSYHFPYVSLWWLGGPQVLLAGSMAPFQIDGRTLRTRLASTQVLQDLERLGTISYVGMLSMYVMGRESLAEWAGGMPAGPGTRNFLLYRAPRATGRPEHVQTLAGLEANRQDPAAILSDSEGNSAEATIVADQIERCVDARGMYSRALTALSERNLRQASTYMEAARGNCPENGIHALQLSDFYLSLSRTLAQDRKFVDALATGRRAVESNPASYRALYNLATLETRRDPMETVRLLSVAAQVNPAYLPAQLLQAEAEISGGLVDQASETVARALSMRPFNARARHLRALCLIAKGQLEDARADLAFVVKSEPRNAAALAATAYTWMLENRLDRAEEIYERALDMEPDDLEVLNNLGTVYAEKKQYAKAIGMWERALVLAPNNQNIRDNLSEARQLLGEPR